MNIKELNEKIYELKQHLETVDNKAVRERIIKMNKKQLQVKALKRQNMAKNMPISDATDKILMAI